MPPDGRLHATKPARKVQAREGGPLPGTAVIVRVEETGYNCGIVVV